MLALHLTLNHKRTNNSEVRQILQKTDRKVMWDIGPTQQQQKPYFNYATVVNYIVLLLDLRIVIQEKKTCPVLFLSLMLYFFDFFFLDSIPEQKWFAP